jgi:hypothetical protein
LVWALHLRGPVGSFKKKGIAMKKMNLKTPLHHLTDRLSEVKGGARAVVIDTGLDGSATSTSTANPLTSSGG